MRSRLLEEISFIDQCDGRTAAIFSTHFIHPLSAASIIPGIALTGTWCAPGIREGGGAGRSRGGNAAGDCHPRPGPASRLPRTGKGHRGGPDDRARPPAGVKSGRPQVGEKPTIWLFERGTPGAIAEGWEGAIHLLYEVPTQRPASRLLPSGRFFTTARRESGRGNGEACVESPLHGTLRAHLRDQGSALPFRSPHPTVAGDKNRSLECALKEQRPTLPTRI